MPVLADALDGDEDVADRDVEEDREDEVGWEGLDGRAAGGGVQGRMGRHCALELRVELETMLCRGADACDLPRCKSSKCVGVDFGVCVLFESGSCEDSVAH